MGMLPREQLRQLIKENDIKDVNGIYTLKDMFQERVPISVEFLMHSIAQNIS